MKILILTQVLDKNDDVLGFMHGWVREFSRQCDRVTVIALRVGAYDLPDNVRILSLGKEKGRSRVKYLFNFYRYIIRYRGDYDAVFVHMNQEYIILGGPLWFLMGKTVSLWYAHGHVPWTLRVAEKMTQVIYTSTASGFRLESPKVNVIGQGIDTSIFVPPEERGHSSPFRIITVGRISPVKDLETLTAVALLLARMPSSPETIIVGGPGTPEQEIYARELERTTKAAPGGDRIFFVGAVPNLKTLPYLQGADLFVNTSHTGSLDKAVLEAMAAGLPVLTCNEALAGILGPHSARLMFPKKDRGVLKSKILEIMTMSPDERHRLGDDLRSIVVRDHGLPRFVREIVSRLQNVRKKC